MIFRQLLFGRFGRAEAAGSNEEHGNADSWLEKVAHSSHLMCLCKSQNMTHLLIVRLWEGGSADKPPSW
jgi:hypothetical protein